MDSKMDCIDLHGRTIAQGLHFVPGPDTCTLCICDNGNPKWCKAVLCSPPQDCKSFRVGNSCCEFICLDDTLGKGDSEHDFNADLGLRLIATAITAILSLSLLFFLIHRLRQRKIRGRQNRELSEEDRSLGSIGYIAGSLGYLGEAHFEEPSSQYPLWKRTDNFYTRGEAPPPYEEAVAAARAEAALARINPGPSVISQIHSQQQHRTIPVNLATSGALVLPPPIEEQQQQQPPPPAPTVHQLPNGPPEVELRLGGTGEQRIAHIEELDDYRSECENCNIRAQQLDGELEYEEDLQTMTLHRRTQDGLEQQPFYRTSLTLPTQVRKQRGK